MTQSTIIGRFLVFLSFSVLLCFQVDAQDKKLKGKDKKAKFKSAQKANKGLEVQAEVINGDTFPVKYLGYYTVVAERQFRNPLEAKRWARLKHNVKKVYPYAKLAAVKMEEYAEEIASAETERERKKFYKEIEKSLLEEYEGEMRSLTMTQGRILIKLIDRETGNTSYNVVKEFRGGFSAFFWQGLARVFGQNLKSEYDPDGEDRDIEAVVQLIESGNL